MFVISSSSHETRKMSGVSIGKEGITLNTGVPLGVCLVLGKMLLYYNFFGWLKLFQEK